MRLLILTVCLLCTSVAYSQSVQVAKGHLPTVVAEEDGGIHLVFGQDSTLFYAVASKHAASFSQPKAIATLPQLVAGAKRGPQIAVTPKYVVVTAVNRAGDIFAYSLNRHTGKWSPAKRINDVPEITKEGFQAVTAASTATFHATWLDLREDKRNKLVMVTSNDGGRTWSANRVVYRSPSGTICECCKVSISAKDDEVYIQFRNWLDGSRDLYLAQSPNGGATFNPPQKLGVGTWKLNACPMDGGAVSLSSAGRPLTVWRRENMIYTCQPGEQEHEVAMGRNVTLTTRSALTALAWDEGGTIWLKYNQNKPIALGKGQIPSIALSGNSAVCVWESDGQVMQATVPF